MSGSAFVYYGEEIGLTGSGRDENKRAPMLWSSDSSAEGMTKGPADMEPQENRFASVEEQMKNSDSIYNQFQTQLITDTAAHIAEPAWAALFSEIYYRYKLAFWYLAWNTIKGSPRT